MIHIFPATFAKVNLRPGCRQMSFEIDDVYKESTVEIFNSSMGQQFLLVAYEIGEDSESIEKAAKDSSETRNLLMKQVHAIVAKYSLETGVKAEKIKKALRERMKAKGLLEKSASELDERGLAVAVYVLNTELNPRSFNYEDKEN